MSKEGEDAFYLGAEFWEQYEIFTDDDGRRFLNVGVYIYCAENDVGWEDGIIREWREVHEYVSYPLEKVLEIIDDEDTLWNQSEYDFRPIDDMGDLTEEEARQRFVNMYDSNIKMNMKEIRADTPDGVYFGVTI